MGRHPLHSYLSAHDARNSTRREDQVQPSVCSVMEECFLMTMAVCSIVGSAFTNPLAVVVGTVITTVSTTGAR